LSPRLTPPQIARALVAPNIQTLSPYIPGKPIEEVAREYGVDGAVKLASNENPIGPSPLAVQAIRHHLLRAHLYPDGSAFVLRKRLAEHHGVSASEVVVGNGTNEIITLLARTFLSPGDEAVISQQTFAIYQIALQACDRRFTAVPLRDHRYDLAAMAQALGPRTKIVFIANPDNPNGTYVTRAELEAFLQKMPAGCLTVLDEAYFEFAHGTRFPDYPDGAELRKRYPGLVVLRTFSKIYGLAGVRVGYGLCEPVVTQYLDRVRDAFNVSSIAQWAAVAALDDRGHVERTLAVVAEGREMLTRELPRFGFRVVPSAANFVLCEIGRSGKEFFEALLPHGVIVRPLDAYLMPQAVRISVGTPNDNQRLLSAIERVMAGDKVPAAAS
jgi:histidinol-phosphate aminotransferase